MYVTRRSRERCTDVAAAKKKPVVKGRHVLVHRHGNAETDACCLQPGWRASCSLQGIVLVRARPFAWSQDAGRQMP